MATPRKRRKRGDKDYINNKEFTDEIIKCKETGELSKFAIDCFLILAERAIGKLHYSDPLDREDCIQSALFDLVKYWKNFDPSKATKGYPPNAFAYFTQISKNGYTKEFKKLHKEIGKDYTFEKISLDQYGDSSIYTI